MKGLLFLAVMGLLVWFWQNRQATRPTPKPKPPPEAAQDMARCAHCGLHFPAADALSGPNGSYCSADHLHQSGG